MDFFWENPGWESADRHLRALKAMPFLRPFPFIPEKEGLYVIRGPRQIGKSSWLKSILSHFSKQHRCFFASCEEVPSFAALGELLRSIKDREVICLDEINFVEEWDRPVKHFIDSGYRGILVLTGSHTLDLKRGADRMPGRFDGGGEYLLLPMDFDEFAKARLEAGWHCRDRVTELSTYFKVGGFPAAIAEAGASNKTPKKALDTYWRWLSGDVTRLGKSENILSEVLAQLARTIQTPVSLSTLAKRSGIGSHNTVAEYIEILESCFALKSLYAVDPDTGARRFRKERKFYFTDPLIYWLGFKFAGLKISDDTQSNLAELVAHEHLSRRYEGFGYFQSRNGEVDFLSSKKWAIEVKWSPAATNLSKAYLNIQVPEKTVWTQSNFLVEWPRLGKGDS